MTTINDYISTKPEEVQARLESIRKIAHEAIPQVEEAVKWGSPAFLHPDGMILAVMAAYKNHINVTVTPSALQANADIFKDFDLGKGSVKIPHDVEIPSNLIKTLIEYRYNEYTESGVKWM